MPVSLVFSEVISGFLVRTNLLFFGCKRQRVKIFSCPVFVDFSKAIFAPGSAKKEFAVDDEDKLLTEDELSSLITSTALTDDS